MQFVIFSSVAGDRLRESNYIYGMTKKCLDDYGKIIMSKNKDIIYQNIKPGIIKTKMTKNFNTFHSIGSEECGKQICKIIINKKTGNFYVPSYWKLIMTIIKLLPQSILNKIR